MSISRSQMSKFISNDRVSIKNKRVSGSPVVADAWKVERSASTALRTGSYVSIEGLGRCAIADIETTAKGRYKVAVKRIKYPQVTDASPPNR